MIKKYIITYDLNKPGQDYTTLINEIKKYDFIKVMESTWFVKSIKSADEISNSLKRFIDNNDRLFVSEITSNCQGWLDKRVWEWLNKSAYEEQLLSIL